MEYEKVPDIIGCKDLDYLSDIFNWNYGGYKSSQNAVLEIEDAELAKQFKKASKLFYNGMNTILEILGGNNE